MWPDIRTLAAFLAGLWYLIRSSMTMANPQRFPDLFGNNFRSPLLALKVQFGFLGDVATVWSRSADMGDMRGPCRSGRNYLAIGRPFNYARNG